MPLNEKKISYSFSVDQNNSGIRIDVFLSQEIPGKSRSYIQKLIEGGEVLINNISVSKNAVLSAGDVILVKSLKTYEHINKITPSKMDLNILYEDEFFLIISKPPGLTVHPAPGHYENTLANALLYYFKNNKKSIFSDNMRSGIVHRLDKDTSGLIIVAKSDDTLAKLSDLFKNRLVKKTYISLVAGFFEEKEGRISLPLGRSRIDRKKISVSPDSGKHSETMFCVLETFKHCTLINASPLTGRTHQIRVHLSFIGHPVVGDLKYGNKLSSTIASETNLKRHFLHAERLEFKHPFTGKEIDIKDNLPDDLEDCLKILKKSF